MSFLEDEADDEIDTFDDEAAVSPLDEATSLTINQPQTVQQSRDLYQHGMLIPGEIRLLEILPDTCEPFFHFGFKIFNRDDAPPYSAISYVWGLDEPSCQIFLHDQMFLVRENLLACLSSVVKRRNLDSASDVDGIDFEDHLWIDAICIDQSQTTERNEQVRCMDKIYAGAESVLAWLGTTFEPGCGLLRSSTGRDFWTENMHHLANRPYWSRMWVVQEFTLAKKILVGCGRYWIEETEFFNRIRSEHRSYAATAFQQVERPARKRSLGVLLPKYGYKNCTDPRDRIYALLGCIYDSERQSLQQHLPDYNLNYYETVVVTLAHMQDFVSRDDVDERQPTWKPDGKIVDVVLHASGVFDLLMRDTNSVFAKRNNTKQPPVSAYRMTRRCAAMFAQQADLLEPNLLEDPYADAKRLHFYLDRGSKIGGQSEESSGSIRMRVEQVCDISKMVTQNSTQSSVDEPS